MSTPSDPEMIVVFDIDGTLVDSVALHQQALSDAVKRSSLLSYKNTRWGDYANHTDSGIFWEAFERGARRSPTDLESRAFEREFQQRYAELARDVSLSEICGASFFLRALAAKPNIKFAFATGSYRAAAEHKLESIGVSFKEATPLVTASEFRTRREIVSMAAGSSKARRLVSVGDGLWDAKTAAELKYTFIGIASAEKAEELASFGAESVLTNYVDLERALSALLGTQS